MEYKDLAISLAKQAGEIMRQNFTLSMKREWKSDNSPVTETDIAINKLVIQEINKHFPEHDIKGEEESDITRDSEYLWVCDPLDGTYNFSHFFPIVTFGLALVKDGKPIMGCVYDPFMNHLYYAEEGRGAFLNDQPIQVSENSIIDRSVIELSISIRSKYDIWDLFGILGRKNGRIVRIGSTIYAGSMVANGNFSAMIYGNNNTHDIAALKIIVEEAGGKVTDLLGNEQRYDQDIKGAIISNGKIHNILVAEVGKILN